MIPVPELESLGCAALESASDRSDSLGGAR